MTNGTDAANPTFVHHTTVNIASIEQVQIVVGQSSDRWYKALHDLHDRRIFRELSDRAFRVFRTLEHFRDDKTGNAHVTMPMFREDTGYSERSVYYAIKELLSNPNRLLAVQGRDLYAVLPGWSFAGRVHDGAELRKPVQNVLHRRAGFLHERAELSAATKETGARSTEEIDIDDDDVRVKALTEKTATNARLGGPFALADAKGVLRMTGASIETVTIALRNAEAKAKASKPDERLKNWRAYVRTQLARGCTLFASLANTDDEAQRNAVHVRRMLEWAIANHQTDAAVLVQEWWNAMPTERKAKAIAQIDRDGLGSDDRRWEVLCSKAMSQAVRT